MQCLKSSAESGEQKFLNTMFPTIQQYTTGLLCIAVWSTRYGRSAISYERLHRFDLRFCLTFDYFLSEYLSALYLRMFTFRAATARRPYSMFIYQFYLIKGHMLCFRFGHGKRMSQKMGL